MFSSRWITGCMSLSALLIVSGACTRTEEGTADRARQKTAPDTAREAYVRYVNAMSANSGTELYFGDTKLSGTGTRTTTDYIPVQAGRGDFSLRQTAANNLEPIAKETETLQGGAHYTVVAFEDADSKPDIQAISDEADPPADGKAKVRIVDAASKADGFDLYAAGQKDKLAGESKLSAVSRWQEVTPAQAPLELQADDNKGTARVPDVLQAGKLYTLIAKDGTATEPIQVVALENAPTKLDRPGMPPPPVY